MDVQISLFCYVVFRKYKIMQIKKFEGFQGAKGNVCAYGTYCY